MTPPRVMSFSFGKEPKGVHKPRGCKCVDAFSFFFREAVLALVRFGIGEILRRVRHIEVAAENDRFSLFKQLEKREKGGIPVFVAQCETGKVGLCVRRIGIYEENPAGWRPIFSCNQPALGVWIAVAIGEPILRKNLWRKAQNNAQRLDFCEDRRTGVAPAAGRGIPIFFVIGQIDFRLALLCLRLLKAGDIRFHFLEKRHERSFSVDAPNAVHVPRDKFHALVAYSGKGSGTKTPQVVMPVYMSITDNLHSYFFRAVIPARARASSMSRKTFSNTLSGDMRGLSRNIFMKRSLTPPGVAIFSNAISGGSSPTSYRPNFSGSIPSFPRTNRICLSAFSIKPTPFKSCATRM